MVRTREGYDGTKRTQRSQKRVAPVPNSDTEIWTSMLDGRYTVTVHRLAPYRGELTILDGTAMIHRQEVALMYGALFGPDVDDVAAWQDIATEVVDGAKHLPEAPRVSRAAGGPDV
jgi:hypothetical protein